MSYFGTELTTGSVQDFESFEENKYLVPSPPRNSRNTELSNHDLSNRLLVSPPPTSPSSFSTNNSQQSNKSDNNDQFKNAVNERLAKLRNAYLTIINHLIEIFFDKLRLNVNSIHDFEFEYNITDLISQLEICPKMFFAQGSTFINDVLLIKLESAGVPLDKFKISFSGFTFKVQSNYDFNEHFVELLND